MWTGGCTDTYYQDTFSLVCYKHKDQRHEVKNREEIEKMLRETFTLMKIKCMSFVLEDDCKYHDDVFRKWLYGLNLFEKKFFHLHDEKVKEKAKIILIESVTTFTLSLLSKICCICTKVTSLDDLKAHRDKQELYQTTDDDSKFFEYILFAVLTHPHYIKVKGQFSDYDINLVNFAFAASCYAFASTFGTDIKEFWDPIVETPTYHELKHRGNEAYKNKDYNHAFNTYLEALKHFPYSFHLFGNCAQVSLSLHNYESAELLSRFALIFNPQWCKAYYKLAASLFNQEKIHEAHLVAAFGLKQCEFLTCNERDTLKEYVVTYESACEVCKRKEQLTDLKNDTQEEPSYVVDSGNSNVPELTDSTDHSSSETDSMSDVDTSESAILCNMDKETSNGEVLDPPADQSEQSEILVCKEIISFVKSIKLNSDVEPELKGGEETRPEQKDSEHVNIRTKEDLQSILVACNGDSSTTEELSPFAKAILKRQMGNVKLEDVAKSVPIMWPKFVNLINRLGMCISQEGAFDKDKNFIEERYVAYIHPTEPLSVGFSLISDMKDVAISKQIIRLDQNRPIHEQHEYIRLVVEKEKAILAKIIFLNGMLSGIEMFPLKSTEEKLQHKSAKHEPKSDKKSSNVEVTTNTDENADKPKSDEKSSNVEKTTNTNENADKPKSGEKSSNVEETTNTDENADECVYFENALREGASAMKMGLTSFAVLHFSQALDMTQQMPELCEKCKVNAVAVKLVYAFACYKCSTFEGMNKAILTFKEIISSETQHLAPVHYLIGLSFIKFHKFRVALTYLKTVASMSEEDFNFNICNLLDENCIKEITYESIQESLKDEISRCECPPPPDALCKYESCIFDPAIYFADLSFKKLMCVRCQERCVLQYHVSCWKAIKEAFSKTDKEFLDCPCFTPDCDGLIIKVETVGKDGVLERDFTSEGNYKPKKCTKQKKTKLEKKQEQKLRKRRQNRSRTASENLEASVDEPESIVLNAQPNELNTTDCQSPTKVKKNFAGDAQCPADEETKLSFEMPVNAEPMYIIKKDSNEKECEYKPSKHKERKKPKKSVLTIDEFCEGYSTPNVTNWNDYQLRLHRLQESKRVVEEQAAVSVKWSDDCDNVMAYMPISYVPDAFEISSDVKANMEIFDTHNDYYETDETQLRATINLHFDKFLQNHRTVKVTDPVLLQEISKLSKEARDLIDRKGGFLPFLQGSEEFAVVNGDLCHFNDMMNLYLPPIGNVVDHCPSNEMIENIDLVVNENNNMYHYMDMNQSCCPKNIEELDDFTEGCDTNTVLDNVLEDSRPNEIITALNPNAVEYNPSKETSSEDSHSSQDALKKNLVRESLERNHTSFLSRVAGMRQELKAYSVVVEAEKNAPCDEPESPEPTVEVSEPQKDLGEEDVTNYPLFVDYFHSHIATLVKNGEKNKISRAYHCLKFLMHQLGKTTGFLVDASEQIGSSSVISMVSQGVMKEDNELVQLTVEAEILKNMNKKMSLQMTSTEEQLTEALDRQTELQNKYQVEVSSLKKELEDNQSTFQENKQELKKKQSILEKELKLCRQKHNQQMDKEKESHTENEILQMKSKNLTNKISELEKECDNLKMELQLKMSSHSEILNEYERELQKEIDEKRKAQAEVLLVKEVLKNAELQILNIKKDEYLKAFEVTLARVNSNMQELNDGIQRMDNMNPIVRSTLKVLLNKLNEYINQMHITRLKYIADIATQIKEIESGVSLSLQPELKIPTFPPLPTIDTILDKAPPEQALPGSMASSTQQVPTVNSFRSNDPLAPKSFPGFSSQMLHPSLQGSMPWSMNPTAGIGLIKPPLSSQSIGHLAQRPQQNSLFPNFNVPMFTEFQPLRTSSTLGTTPAVPPQLLPSPIGSQLSLKSALMADSFTANFGTAFNQKIPPGLCSQPTNSTNSITPFATELKQKPLPAENRSKSLTPSLVSASDTESGSHSIPSESVAPEDSNGNKGLMFSNTVKKTVSSGGFVTVENTKKPHRQADAASILELDYYTQQPNVNAVSKPSSLSGTEADASLSAEKAILKGGYRKIINTLKVEFPNAKDSEVMSYVKQYRIDKGGKLSNLPFTTIISEIKDIMLRAKKQPVRNLVAYPINRPKALLNKTLTSCSTPAPPPPAPKTTAPIAPWAKAPETSEKLPQNWLTNPSEKSCAICLEEMTIQTAYKMDCVHQFHFKCIKQWLNKQSNCPVCRVHLLLPEDFPSLP